MQTNTNKLKAWALLACMALISNMSIATASQIGTGTVQWSGAMATPINWNDIFPGTASGTINGLTIKAKILPTLNMAITGTGTMDLGNLTSATYSTGTVSIEIGTNAANGASVTAKSTNGGLKTTGTGTDILNNLNADGAQDSYVFTSIAGAVTDSSFSGTINQTFFPSAEISSTANNVIYNSARPQPSTGTDDITFSVSTKPNAQSPAGNYTDVIVLTVTGTF